MQSYVKTNVTQFNPGSEIAKMWRKGLVGEAAGWEWYRSNLALSAYHRHSGNPRRHHHRSEIQSGNSLTVP